MKRKTRIKMIVQSPSDRNSTIMLPYAVAWAAARGIAKDTHYAVTLYGELGTARFNHTGDGGIVEWNERSTTPGQTTTFAENANVSI